MFPMARFAIEAQVLARQRETGVGMIVARRAPRQSSVTLAAIGRGAKVRRGHARCL